MKKVELLSPAGNFKALKGAIHAGADAVYLGGERYGARAYADNFTEEEIIQGIHLAHVFGRKIYLTVNTLVKEKELDFLYDFLLPFYEAGLDGVIVQDFGAFRFIKAHFPGLLLHASTQMTVTGWRGTEFLQKEGISRIVPARELSLNEIVEIKKRTGVETEAFIHGAMCYAYSGQCLFSSILGGRSGNRGRCAQPCRLPYHIGGNSGQKEPYPLSMRDMCTLEILPELIEVGIDSFKIEGRMKRPEYTAGVTAIYRKYIDKYYESCSYDPSDYDTCEGAASNGKYQIEKKDLERLNLLYIRSGTGQGYYHRHNGKDMLTLTSPAYTETDEKLLKDIRETYLDKQLSVAVNAKVTLEAGKCAELTLEGGGESVVQTGDMVQEAQNQPLSEEKVVSQIQKSGQSLLSIDSVEVYKPGEIFIPVGALNRLRREASEKLVMLLAEKNGQGTGKRSGAVPIAEGVEDAREEKTGGRRNGFLLHALVRTKEQLYAAIEQKIERIYLDYTLLADEKLELPKEKTAFYAVTPFVVRNRNEGFLEMICRAVLDGLISGVLIRNLESYAFFEHKLASRQMVLDAGLYLWNRESIRFWTGRVAEYYLPVECNAGEWKSLSIYDGGRYPVQSVQVYGRLPMMISANCIKKTSGVCEKDSGIVMMEDRYGTLFPVYHDCMSCYNVIYNSVPLSLHGMFQGKKRNMQNYRIDFTTENSKETSAVIRYFKGLAEGRSMEPVYSQYTTGHYKRGVE